VYFFRRFIKTREEKNCYLFLLTAKYFTRFLRGFKVVFFDFRFDVPESYVHHYIMQNLAIL
jgi:hypothetical protein